MTDSQPRQTAAEAESWPRLVRWEWVLLAVVLVAIVATRLSTLDQRLLEAHSFRQTFVAFQTLGFYESGIDLLRPMIPVLGAPWTIPFEFPLFQALASIPMSWGLDADTADRATALVFFIVSAGALWALVRIVAGRRVAAIALVVFSFSPFALLWSRASMMEYLATAAALGWVISALRWRQKADWRWAILAILLGAIAFVVKLTTAFVWVVPILLFRPDSAASPSRLSLWVRERLHPAYLSMLIVPGLAGVAWTLHADAVKEASAATSALVSTPQFGFIFGTLSQRFSAADWGVIVDRIDSLILGRGLVVVAVIAVMVVKRHRPFWIGMLLVPLVAVEVFFNLYRVHDYYLVAVSPALAALVAIGLSSLVHWVRVPVRWRGLGVAGVTLLWLGLNLALTQSYWSAAYEDLAPPGPSREISALTGPDEYSMVHLVASDRSNWSPAVLYYAERRGMMLTDFITVPIMANQADLNRYRLLWTEDPQGPEVDFAALRPWYSPVSEHALALGAGPDDLGDVSVMASTDSMTPDGPTELLVLERDHVVCDGSDSLKIPSGRGSAWLTVRAEGDARARLRPGLVAVPSATRTVVWHRTADDGTREPQWLACFGGGSLTIMSAVDSSFGLLRVVTDPPVPAQLLVDGDSIGSWDSGWLKFPPGAYEVSFSEVEGFATPDAQTVTVVDGVTTEVSGVFTPRGWLRVVTDPAVSATISVDGSVMGDSGVWAELPIGSHEVCISDVAYYTEPACETVTFTAGETTTIARGSLRVVTSPPVPSQILVDGVVIDAWNLDWLTLPEGDYEVSFSGVSGFTRPDAQTVTVVAGATTEVTGVFAARGWLQVATNPAVPSLILVDGVPYGSWGLDRLMLSPGDYEISFSDVDGFTTPDPQTVTIAAGVKTELRAVFALQGSLQVITDPAVPSQILVGGVAVGEWGAWIDLAAGDHEVCFGAVTGLTAPACETATVTSGEITIVTGVFTGFP